MRLVVLSDTHGQHDKITDVPEGDILIHAGDFMNSGTDMLEIISFNRWLGEQPFRHRVVCAGNHDKYFESDPGTARALLTNAHYLENSEITIEGIRLWGSQYTPRVLSLGLHVSSRNCCYEVLGQHSRTSRRADNPRAAVRNSRSDRASNVTSRMRRAARCCLEQETKGPPVWAHSWWRRRVRTRWHPFRKRGIPE